MRLPRWRRTFVFVQPHDRALGEAMLEEMVAHRNVEAALDSGAYTCPCCGHATLTGRGAYEVCSERDWEDDGQDDHDSAVVRLGPNGGLSLDAARAAYERSGGIRVPHTPPRLPDGPR